MNNLGPLQRDILAIMADGEWRTCSAIGDMLGKARTDVYFAIYRLRNRGVVFEAGHGPSARGFRLIGLPEPDQVADDLANLRRKGFTDTEARAIVDEHLAVVERRKARAA